MGLTVTAAIPMSVGMGGGSRDAKCGARQEIMGSSD